jgi:ribonucleoside-diphosphate reductase alpha chain
MGISPNALTVLEKRYLLKDSTGKTVETVEGLFMRVAKALAAPDRLYGALDPEVAKTVQQFYDLTYNLDFLPNSPTLANAGTPLGQLSACFVLPVPDDLGDIFETIKQAALIHQSGGGTGFAFTRLRPKNDLVQSTKGVSSGPLSFMDVFNAATESIKQGGMRRGANMGILRIDHPDIMDFIKHKEDLTKLTNFNISVAITDAFMAAVEAGTSYDLINPRSKVVMGQLVAREVFRTIVQRAWNTGEPGLVFMDRMNRYCPVPWMGEYEATNPCGEQPLIPFESCNLGSINLERFVIPAVEEVLSRDHDGSKGISLSAQPARIDWDRLRGVVHVSTHLLDNVIDANKYPLQEIADVTQATRKIGLGVMGFARMLFLLGVGYGTPESLAIAEQLMSFIDYESKVKSIELSRQRGPFPGRIGHEQESNQFFARMLGERAKQPGQHPFCDFAGLIPLIEQHGIRNSTTTTIAPTGTLSIIADTSGGCEPIFALAFARWQADTHMVDVDEVFKDYAKARGFYSDALMEAIDLNHGTLVGLQGFEVPTSAVQIFRTAHDISPLEHVFLQAAFQKYNDSATSKTINFSEHATLEDVETAYRLAWDTGCKGITVYRNNSRKMQPLSVKKKEEAVEVYLSPDAKQLAYATLVATMSDEELETAAWATMKNRPAKLVVADASGGRAHEAAFALDNSGGLPWKDRDAIEDGPYGWTNFNQKPVVPTKRPRPEELFGFTRTTQTGDGKLYTTVNYDAHGIREVVTNIGRSGGTIAGMSEAIGRLISLALQHNVPNEDISKTLIGVRGPTPHGFGDAQVLSVPDAIGRVLRDAPNDLAGLMATPASKEVLVARDKGYQPTTFDVPAGLPLTTQVEERLHAVYVLGQSPDCPECGRGLVFGEGCKKCPDPGCGYSACG